MYVFESMCFKASPSKRLSASNLWSTESVLIQKNIGEGKRFLFYTDAVCLIFPKGHHGLMDGALIYPEVSLC